MGKNQRPVVDLRRGDVEVRYQEVTFRKGRIFQHLGTAESKAGVLLRIRVALVFEALES